MHEWISWNGNKRHKYTTLVQPRSEKELAEVVAHSSSVRVIGNGQSSADIVAGTDTLIDLRSTYASVVAIDKESRLITVQAGMNLKTLLETMESHGWTLPCLPDIDSISVGGALSTGTHGTGRDGKPLASYVESFRVIHADGTIKNYVPNDPLFSAFSLSLGLLGVLSEVTFHGVPLYNLHLYERPVKDKEWIPQLKYLLVQHPFVRVLWLPHTNIGYLITGDLVKTAEAKNLKKSPWWHTYRRACSKLFYSYTHLFPWSTVIANRLLALLFFNSKIRKYGSLYGATVTKSRGSTLELAEWTIPLSRFEETFYDLKKTLNALGNGAYAHIPMDVRYIASDDSWLGYAQEGGTVTVGCVARNAAKANYYRAFDAVEEVFYRHGGRPHWAKRFSLDGKKLALLYPKWDDFCIVREKLDPQGKFLNDYLQGIFQHGKGRGGHI